MARPVFFEQAIIRGLVLMLVFFADILLRLFVEGLLAAERAEVIRLAFVFGLASCGCRVNVHSAHGIFDSCDHSFLLFFFNYG
jgi:hypothetical protein